MPNTDAAGSYHIISYSRFYRVSTLWQPLKIRVYISLQLHNLPFGERNLSAFCPSKYLKFERGCFYFFFFVYNTLSVTPWHIPQRDIELFPLLGKRQDRGASFLYILHNLMTKYDSYWFLLFFTEKTLSNLSAKYVEITGIKR